MSDIGYRNGATRTTYDRVGSPLAGLLEDKSSAAPSAEPATAGDNAIITVEDDGSVSIEYPSPAVHRKRETDPKDFSNNIALEHSDSDLSALASDYLDGVAQDILSRSQFISNYNKGIDLLGLKIEEAASTRGTRSSISRVRNPGLLKACVRSQSMARGQLLPPQGPVKIQTIGNSNEREDDLAQAMQQDFNYYLTDVAREFVPDTDRMLFYRAFGGSAYKKVYRCPLRQRPVSESVQLDNLIVSEDATDLDNALRKTNEILMSPVMLRRMQLFGGWKDVALGTPQQNTNPARRKIMESQGLTTASLRPQDQSFNIYEGSIFIDPADYGIEEWAPGGMPLPYRVIVDKDSHQILGLYRNWKQDDDRFQERRMYVKYGLVPGLGFLDYGFLHLIGNQVRFLTAAWQILSDKGMLANFPGGMKVKGVRTATNEINPGLGEWVEVDIGGKDDIRKAMMAMPYGDITPGFFELIKEIEADMERLSGTVEIEGGSNRQNMPVGTILAQIEQQTQDLTAVHQRDHRSQKEELQLLRDLFVENPEDMRWMSRRGSKLEWANMVEAFSDADLSPASDPNVPSQAHRIMQNMFLMQMAQAAPGLFGQKLPKVAKRIITSVGISDADDMLASPQEFSATMAAMAKGKKGGGDGGAAKAQIEAPLKAAELKLQQEKLGIQREENQRKAANEAAQAHIDIAKAKADHAHNLASTIIGAHDPLLQANLEKTKAQTFASIAGGIAQLAKNAGMSPEEGVEGEEMVEGSQPPKTRSLRRPSRARKTSTTEGE